MFASPAGGERRQRMVAAAHVVMTPLGHGGIRQVRTVLHRSGLSRQVGSSSGSQPAWNVPIEQAIVEYGRQPRESLRVGVPARDIPVCEDETSHPQPGLVSLEPVSGFIVLERYAKDRSADTGDRALEEATEGLPVPVIQGTSDQANGLLRPAENQGAQASPDLFHLQHDRVKATGLALRRAERQAETALAAAEAALTPARQAADDYRAQAPRRGRPIEKFERQGRETELHRLTAQVELEQAQQRRQQARTDIRQGATVYHPDEVTTGAARTTESWQADRASCMNRLERPARDARLSERGLPLLDKAKGARLSSTITTAS